ncbi:sulfatase family protein [Humisphaera borealis]|uniref:Sulfatase n=1 Tax=Humisphaera borealis TaxID=2807512 RepID=A0A7M2X0P8_9BACT|nr:sulfatase [Humisphaera borealis]QOV91002.1 sulfatase [Humisphaera borealis]
MGSRSLLARLPALILATFVTAVASHADGADPVRPNILLILSDDHSYPYLGCYGDPVVKTPNLDRFASEGMKFERAFTSAPQCVLSRAAILTGRSPVACRISRFNSPLPPDVVTLPEILRKDAGYFTGVCRRSFHLDGSTGKGASDLTKELYESHKMQTWDRRVDYLDRNSPPAMTVPKVNEFLDKLPAGKPFFLWVNFNDPHHPWDAGAIAKPYDPSKIKLPVSLPDLSGVRADLARYLGEIARMDGEFQSVLDQLSKRNLLDNTIVVFMGDNGMAFPHGKGSLYDPGLNVPLLIRWPGRIKPGGSSQTLISGEDITPTLLDAAGCKSLPEMTGRSFLALLTGGNYEARKFLFGQRGVHGSATFDETTKASGYDLGRCVRSDRYKLIYNCTPNQVYAPVDSAGDPGWKQMVAANAEGKLATEFSKAYFSNPRPIYELYDLEKDPGELENLAGRKETRDVEMSLKRALHEKMIVDYDYLPLPLK